MDRRRPPRTDDSAREANEAAREAANVLTYFGTRYPVATVVVIGLALVVGLAWYWHEQRRLSQQQEQQARQTQTPPQPTPTPAPEPSQPPASQASSSSPAAVVEGPSEGAVNMLLGNPSGAVADPASRDNYLMVKRHYALSYNDSKGTPNWVSWRVTKYDLGDAPRKRQFDPDGDLASGFYRVTHRDYTGGGFDRGHMCPHSDRANSQEASFATFVMSNIIPQAPNVNQGAWAQLEDYTRD